MYQVDVLSSSQTTVNLLPFNNFSVSTNGRAPQKGKQTKTKQSHMSKDSSLRNI